MKPLILTSGMSSEFTKDFADLAVERFLSLCLGTVTLFG